MADSSNDTLTAFVDQVLTQLRKNGYPERRVAFPLERMYESASAKGLSFNRVLELLGERGVGHEKTTEKVIFAPASVPAPASPDIAGFDPALFAGMSQEQLFSAAQAAMQQMGPERLAALRAMVEGMTPEQQAAMLEQARKLGLA